MTQFPHSLDQLDAEWLDAALHGGGALPPEARLTGFSVRGVGSGFGQTGDSVRLSLEYDRDAAGLPASAFIKFSTANAARRAASRSLDLYGREVRFYADLRDQAQVRAPRCYFAGLTPDREIATLLLEDFPDHRPGDDVAGVTRTEAEAIISAVAGLHAHFWGRAADAGLTPLHMGGPERYAPAWDVTVAQFGQVMHPEVLRQKARFIAAIEGLHRWLLAGDATIGHGDLKLDNILFGPQPEREDAVVLVDWQAVRPQKGVRDVAYLICHSMPVSGRREHDRALLDHYRRRLAAQGVDYPESRLIEDFRRAVLYDFCTALYIAGVNPNANERANRRKTCLLERVSAALVDWSCFDLL